MRTTAISAGSPAAIEGHFGSMDFRKGLRTVWNLASTRHWRDASLLAGLGLRIPRVRYTSDGRLARSRDGRFALRLPSHARFLTRLIELEALATLANATFECVSDGELLVRIAGVVFAIDTPEELFILHEVFVEGVYDLAAADPTVVVDIGMNVGIASVFFAKHANVQRVFGFEPFPATYSRALRNFELNAIFSAKISPFETGMATTGRTQTIASSTMARGRNNIYGVEIHEPGDSSTTVTIRLVEAAATLRQILDESSGKFIICKIDCEGAEYEIVASLDAANLLTRFSAFMIEWHYRGPEELTKRLEANGFAVISRRPHGPGDGMIYAVYPRHAKA